MVPENFDFKQLLKENPPKNDFNPVDYKVYVFLSLIIEKYPYQESLRKQFGDYTFIISKQDIEKKYSIKCLKQMREWLRDIGVIEYSNYEKGMHSRGYRFVGKYASVACKLVEITKKKEFEKIVNV